MLICGVVVLFARNAQPIAYRLVHKPSVITAPSVARRGAVMSSCGGPSSKETI